MNKREKILLLQTLMCDIRNTWDDGKYKRYKDKRVWKCLELIDELCDTDDIFSNLYNNIGVYLCGRHEGRILRTSYKDGGYEGLEDIHRYSIKTFKHRSDEFKKSLKTLSKYPKQYNF